MSSINSSTNIKHCNQLEFLQKMLDQQKDIVSEYSQRSTVNVDRSGQQEEVVVANKTPALATCDVPATKKQDKKDLPLTINDDAASEDCSMDAINKAFEERGWGIGTPWEDDYETPVMTEVVEKYQEEVNLQYQECNLTATNKTAPMVIYPPSEVMDTVDECVFYFSSIGGRGFHHNFAALDNIVSEEGYYRYILVTPIILASIVEDAPCDTSLNNIEESYDGKIDKEVATGWITDQEITVGGTDNASVEEESTDEDCTEHEEDDTTDQDGTDVQVPDTSATDHLRWIRLGVTNNFRIAVTCASAINNCKMNPEQLHWTFMPYSWPWYAHRPYALSLTGVKGVLSGFREDNRSNLRFVINSSEFRV